LLATTKKVRVTGNGTANVNTEQLDYKLTVNWLNALETPPLVINVGGTFSKPSYKLDISAILEDKAKVENLINKVNTQENKEKIEHAIDKLKPEEKEKLQKLAPKVGKLFKKLF
jgi:AsmA protein